MRISVEWSKGALDSATLISFVPKRLTVSSSYSHCIQERLGSLYATEDSSIVPMLASVLRTRITVCERQPEDQECLTVQVSHCGLISDERSYQCATKGHEPVKGFALQMVREAQPHPVVLYSMSASWKFRLKGMNRAASIEVKVCKHCHQYIYFRMHGRDRRSSGLPCKTHCGEPRVLFMKQAPQQRGFLTLG
jgi:hypothetical protein